MQSISGGGYGAVDVVLLPAWQRAAFLFASLTLLLKADNSEDHLYLFQLEHGYSGAGPHNMNCKTTQWP